MEYKFFQVHFAHTGRAKNVLTNILLHPGNSINNQKIVEAECKMMDTEFSLKAANDMYKFQKDEKENMEHSLK